MTEETKNSQYVSYPMFKGLQKPLEFMGIQGRYITWAAIAVGAAILGFIIVYCFLGFVAGLIVLAVSLLCSSHLLQAEEGTAHQEGRPWSIHLCLFNEDVNPKIQVSTNEQVCHNLNHL